jgi:hypothetical protein
VVDVVLTWRMCVTDQETEAAQESPTNGAVRLRGVTVATGGHMRFDKK